MAGFVSKQPKGKYCRFSSTVDSPTHINMDFDDYVNVVMDMQGKNYEAAKREAREVFSYYLRPFDQVIRIFIPNNLSERSFLELVKKMCDPNASYELVEETGIIERVNYENDDEMNAHFLEFENEACKIAGLGPRK